MDLDLVKDAKQLVTVVDFITNSRWYDNLPELLQKKFPKATIGIRANFIEHTPFEEYVFGLGVNDD